MKIHVPMLMLAVCIAPAATAATSDCKENYFAPDDFNHEHSLAQPHPEFMKSMKLAKAGNAMEQRNVAVSYDAGYLVSACPDKAHYWYQKAADKGDQIAKNWIARDNRFKEISAGPEFAVRNDPPNALVLTPATPTATAGSSQTPEPGSLIEKYAQYEQKLTDPTSGYGKLVKAGQLMGDLLNTNK